MLTLPLEPTDDRADPIFKDAASCAQWLEQLQLTNIRQAHSLLLAQINELNRYPMRGLERLNTLESLRETVGFVQKDISRKLAGQPLPLNEKEFAVFLSIVQLWQAMSTGYQRVLQACISGEKQLAGHAALLCQRCLHYSGLEISEHLCTGYEFSDRLWRQLHELYSYAEQQDIHQTEVPDLPGPASCTGSYIKTLLCCYADPTQLTRTQFQLMDQWLSAWSNTVTLSRSVHRSKNDAQPLAIDLSGTQGLQRVEGLTHHDTMRYLAMVPLSKLLRIKSILIQQGQTPQQVGLGDHADSAVCLELLNFLHQCWCEKPRPTRQKSLCLQACSTPEHIYSCLSGRPFGQPAIDGLALRQIETLGHAASRVDAACLPENWLMDNESIMGACLTRSGTQGARIRSRQLIALRPENTQTFILAATICAKVTRQGRLKTMVRYLPGRPEPVRISSYGINPVTVEAPAFLLPALPALNTPQSLILPRNWFKTGRVIKVIQSEGNFFLAKLNLSVECGFDYERASFTKQA